MELTVRRAAAIAMGAFALLVVARPPRPTGLSAEQVSARYRSRVDEARQQLSQTRDTLRLLEYTAWSRQLRDSVGRALRQQSGTTLDRVFADARVPAAVRGHVEQVYATTRARMSHRALALPLVIVVDTAQSYRFGTVLWVERPQDPTPSCATVVRARVTPAALTDERRMARELRRSIPASFPQPRHFGLCGFSGAFGPPSAAVRQWLHEREYRPVAGGYDVSAIPRPPLRLRDEVVPYFNSQRNSAMALDLRACVAGRAEHCLDAIAPPAERPLGGIDDAASDYRWYSWWWRGSPDVMNAVALSLGPERFRALWRAEEPVPDAYRRLSGVPIDTLARRVLVGAAPPVRVGAPLLAKDFVLPLLIAGGLAGLALLSHPRRRRA
ncbi:MAG: hypothetical protein FJ363_06550 [Gemmatimonadetes bacterium]|nr:hypothetical protein [Gemmatimonadota bacterium]